MEPLLADLYVEEYEGDFLDGAYHGEGHAVFKSGIVYTGSFAYGRMHGQGELQTSSGIRYRGAFQGGAITGEGTMSWPNNCRYEGSFACGLRHGHGVFSAPHVTYTGSWLHGRRHGNGKLVTAGGTYDGEFADDVKHGRGVMQYTNGDVYDGEWRHGKKSGHGSMTWHAQFLTYEGEWADNEMHGAGVQTWRIPRAPGSHFVAHNQFRGSFEKGKRHGSGTFIYADGGVLSCTCVEDAKHGPASFVLSNGTKQEIVFEQDKAVKRSPDTVSPGDVQFSFPSLHEETEFQSTQLKNVLQRNLITLRNLYQHYAKLSSTPDGTNVFCLKRFQLLRMLVDAGVQRRGVLPSTADRLLGNVATCWQHDQHRLLDCIIFCEFVNVIVRVADACYKRTYAGREEFLACSVDALLSTDLPNCFLAQTEPLSRPCFPDQQLLVVKIAQGFSSLFPAWTYSNTQQQDHEQQQEEETEEGGVSVQRWLQLLKRKRLVGGAGLTDAARMMQLVLSYYGQAEGETFDFSSKICPFDAWDLAWLALAASAESYTQPVHEGNALMPDVINTEDSIHDHTSAADTVQDQAQAHDEHETDSLDGAADDASSQEQAQQQQPEAHGDDQGGVALSTCKVSELLVDKLFGWGQH